MLSPLELIFLAIGCLLCTIVLRRCLGHAQGTLLHPPGPKKYPFVGNLLAMPTEYEYIQFKKWSQVYGPVIHLSVAGKDIVILDKLDVALELMEKRSSKYSGRPHMTMLMDLFKVGWDWSLVLMNPGPIFNRYRGIFQKGLSACVDDYQQIQIESTAVLLSRLCNTPSEFMSHIEFWAKAMILKSTYGYEPQSKDDYFIWLAERGVEIITRTGQPGAYLVDTLPLLKWIPNWMPGASFKKQATDWSSLVKRVLEDPMNYTKQSLEAGKRVPGYVSDLLHKQDKENSESIIKETAAIMHTAGADSVFSIVQSFVLAMTLHPEIQEQAQIELDSVLGSNNLPSFKDRPYLPFVEHIFLEALRWANAVPLGIAHQLQSDDTYGGMFLPAGSIVMANIWSIQHDPVLYERPFEFDPTRFDKPGAQDPRAFAFGFGRRICAGKRYAEDAVWLAIASILAALKISKATDDFGNEIKPTVKYTKGLICHPLPFECTIKPR